jgi:hypothetical protein
MHPIDSTVAAAKSYGDDVRAKIQAWWAAVQNVKNTPIANNDPTLVQQRTDLLARSETIRNAILKLMDPETAKSIGLAGPELLPLVLGGVTLAGIVAWIGSYMTDYDKYMGQLTANNKASDYQQKVYSDQVASGVPAKEAATNATNAAKQMYNSMATKTVGGVPVTYIAGGLIALGLLAFLFHKKSGGQSPVIMIPSMGGK